MTLLLAFFLFAANHAAAADDVASPALRAELLEMERQDQALRNATPVDVEAVVASDASHTARIDFQLAALALMEPLLASGEVRGESYAYLWDRTHVPQRYGTQGSCVGKGSWKPDPIESPDHVEARRKEMEMEPLVEYVAMASKVLCSRS